MKISDLVEGTLDVPTMGIEWIAKHHGVAIHHIQSQLLLGIKVEMEHTSDKTLASEIARDHLKEDPNYYTKLAKVESNNV